MSLLDLFDGQVTLSEFRNMDKIDQDNLVNARLRLLKKRKDIDNVAKKLIRKTM